MFTIKFVKYLKNINIIMKHFIDKRCEINIKTKKL